MDIAAGADPYTLSVRSAAALGLNRPLAVGEAADAEAAIGGDGDARRALSTGRGLHPPGRGTAGGANELARAAAGRGGTRGACRIPRTRAGVKILAGGGA